MTLLFTVLFVHSTLFASTQTGTVEVIEIVKHKENPILIYVKNWSEEQIRLFEYEKDRANHDKDKEAKEIALAKISGMKAFQKNLNSKINKGLIEIRAWDGENGVPVVLFCQSNENTKAAYGVASRAKSGSLLSFTAEDSVQSVEVRAGREIKWRRGRTEDFFGNTKMEELPFPQDDVTWHWSIDGWEKEWTMFTEKLVEGLRDKSIKYMQVDSGYSNNFVFSLPKYWNVMELERVSKRPFDWEFRSLKEGFQWDTVIDNSINVSVSVEACDIDGRPTSCLEVDGDIEGVYSIKVSIYELKLSGEFGRRVVSDLVIGGMSGGHFGESWDKEILASIEFLDMNPRVTDYAVEIQEIQVKKH